MRIEQVVINASPLITLFRVGLHPLLSQLFTDLVVPDAVWDEVVSGAHDDPATRGLPLAPWVRRVQPAIDPQVTAWNLGAGETAVLSFAHDHPAYTAIVDDRAARRCAHTLGIRLLGTAGVLVLAQRRGEIAAGEPALRQ